LQKLQRSVDSLDKSLNHVEKITGKMADGEGTVGHLHDRRYGGQEPGQYHRRREHAMLHGVSRLQTIVGLRTEYN
jgi:hypothetical protein